MHNNNFIAVHAGVQYCFCILLFSKYGQPAGCTGKKRKHMNQTTVNWPAVNADNITPEELYKVLSEDFCILVSDTSANG